MTSVPEPNGDSVLPLPQKVRTVLLKDLGPRLPLGVSDAGGTCRGDLAGKTWTFREEKELGRLRDQNRDSNMAQYVSMVLATMYDRIGPYDFSAMKFDERRLRIGQMYMGDVYYAYVWLRLQALGPELDSEMTCAACASKFTFPADLETLEIATASSLEPFLWSYDLHVPLVIRDKEVRTLRMGPPLWQAIESMAGTGGMNTGEAKAGIIRGSIVEINGLGNVALTESELDGMVKIDIERIANLLDEHHLGPDMAIEGKCPRGHPFKQPIDWGYDSFFGSSSR